MSNEKCPICGTECSVSHTPNGREGKEIWQGGGRRDDFLAYTKYYEPVGLTKLEHADRATLANVLRELVEVNVAIQERLIPVSEYQTDRHVLRGVLMRVLYCEGRIRGLLAEPIPTNDRGKE